MNDLWIYLLIFIIIFIIFSFVGLRRNTDNRYKSWCNDILLENGFDPPELHIFEAKKYSCVKIRHGIAYIYLYPQVDEKSDKKMLIYLLTYLTTDKYKTDSHYYTNLDLLMNTFENKENVSRVNVDII